MLVVVVIPLGVETTIGLLLMGKTLTDEKIGVVSQMIVQLDSFLTAGAAVGISIFWSGFAKTLRQLSSVSVPLGEEFGSSEAEWAAKEARAIERDALPVAFVGVVFFVVSGVLAVLGEILSSVQSILDSLTFLASGSGIMFYSWYWFNWHAVELNDLTISSMRLLKRQGEIKKS